MSKIKTKSKSGRKRSSARNARRESKKQQEHVLMPGGFRERSKVQLARKKGSTRVVNLARLGIRKSHVSRAGTEKLELTILEAINPAWVATAGFDNNTGKPVVLFQSSIVVPPIPAHNNGQTIFIFIGQQRPGVIAQPVLQFGFSRMGGGPHWFIGSCLAGGHSGEIQHSGLTRVHPGTTVKAVIQVTGAANNKYRYSVFFEGFDSTRIDTPAMQELKHCCATLESYNISGRTDYPNVGLTAVSDLLVRDSNHVIIPPWHADGNRGPLGEHAVVERVAGNPDQVNLHYSSF